MELEKFITDFAELFDDTDPKFITADTKFHDLEEWSSLIGMSIIAMAKTQYGRSIQGKDIRQCETVMDLYNLIFK